MKIITVHQRTPAGEGGVKSKKIFFNHKTTVGKHTC